MSWVGAGSWPCVRACVCVCWGLWIRRRMGVRMITPSAPGALSRNAHRDLRDGETVCREVW